MLFEHVSKEKVPEIKPTRSTLIVNMRKKQLNFLENITRKASIENLILTDFPPQLR